MHAPWNTCSRAALRAAALRPLGAAAVALIAAACAGAPPPAEVATAPAATSRAWLPAPKMRAEDLAKAPVYDASGNTVTCAPPKPVCPEVEPDRGFLDRCRLAGFQVRRCGCDTLCAGDVTAANRHYDLAGNPRDCPPLIAACEVPPASAALQDACAEKGHRLDVCGCEWLCSGNPKK